MLKKLRAYSKQFSQEEYWSIILRRKNNNNEFFKEISNQKFVSIYKSKRYWLADPFLFNHNGNTFLFYEMYDRYRKKGVIGYSKIINEEKSSMPRVTPPKKVLESKFHLSFPCIFIYSDKIYMIPESSDSGEIKLYKAISFPEHWVEEKVLIKNIKAVDTILINSERTFFLLTSVLNSKEYNWLQNRMYKIDMDTFCVSENFTEVKEGNYGVRNAGNIYKSNNNIIRVSQDCSNGDYGKAIILWKVKISDDSTYDEKIYNKISPEDIKLSSSEHIGVHTYNCTPEYEVLDIKYIKRNSIFDKIGVFIWLAFRHFKRRIRRQ